MGDNNSQKRSLAAFGGHGGQPWMTIASKKTKNPTDRGGPRELKWKNTRLLPDDVRPTQKMRTDAGTPAEIETNVPGPSASGVPDNMDIVEDFAPNVITIEPKRPTYKVHAAFLDDESGC